jgi:hypothetical protein
MMRWIGLVLTCLYLSTATAQENSPYSRYGLGDVAPNQNIVNRAMGGIAAGYSDMQSVNFVNPASYGNLSYTLPGYQRNSIFEFGAEADSRTLKSTNPAAKYTATNLIMSYIQLGMPVRLKKLNKKGLFMGLSFGLKPVSKINYKILNINRKAGIDSFATSYEGSGGVNEANVGAGFRFKGFNVGFNTGYRFGNKDYSTKLNLINDTVLYYRSNSATKTNFGGIFLNLGVQYELFLKNKAFLRIGAYGNLSQQMKGSQTTTRETVSYDANGSSYRVDSVYEKLEDGTVTYPASFGIGFTYKDSSNHWTFGADYEQSYWSKYRFFNQSENVQNTWKIRVGAEYLPAGMSNIRNYFSAVKYRAGFYIGTDYINVGNNLPEFGFSFGAGFPMKLRKSFYETQTSYLNTSIEIGSRGDKKSNLRETTLRVCVGLSLGDLWFNRSKYY